MEASGLQLFAYMKTEELTRIVREGVPAIDSVLAAIVSPEASAFTIQQLVRDHEYPAVDLSEIDEAWL